MQRVVLVPRTPAELVSAPVVEGATGIVMVTVALASAARSPMAQMTPWIGAA